MIQQRSRRRVGAWTVQKQDGVLCTLYTLDTLTKLFHDTGQLELVQEPKYCTIRAINRRNQTEMLRVFIQALVRRTR